MLDTDALTLRGLVPPKLKPPSWMRARVNWNHPLSRGLYAVWLLNDPYPLFSKSPVTLPTTQGPFGPQAVGMGLRGSGASVGLSSGGTFVVPKTVGSCVAHVTAGHAPTDSVAHTICHFGNLYPGSAGNPEFFFGKFSDNNWWAGWINGTEKEVKTAATGDYASGDAFTVGLKWKDSVGTELYVKGNSKASVGTTGGTGDTTGGQWVGAIAGGSQWCQGNTDGIHYIAFWERDLSAAEFKLLEISPYCWLEPGYPLLGSVAVTSVTATSAITEPNDALSATTNVLVTPALAKTEPLDTLSATGSAALAPALSTTEPTDTLSASAAVAVVAAQSTTEPIDTLASATAVAVAATQSTTEPVDTLTSATAVAVVAAQSATETVDTLSGAAEVTFSAITASAVVTEPAEQVSAAATLTVAAALAALEPGDTLGSAIVVTLGASLGATEPLDVVSSTATGVTGSPTVRVRKVLWDDRLNETRDRRTILARPV